LHTFSSKTKDPLSVFASAGRNSQLVLVISGTDRRRRAMRVMMMMAVMEVRQHLHPKYYERTSKAVNSFREEIEPFFR
jgi:hypothetical protein